MPKAGYKKRRAKWTEDEVIEKIQEWNSKFGAPPTSTEWNPSDCRRSARISTDRAASWLDRAMTFETGEYPWTGSVQKLFDSWNAAIKAAGFTPRTSTLGSLRKGLTAEGLPGLKKLFDEVEAVKGEAQRMVLYRIAETAIALAEELDGPTP